MTLPDGSIDKGSKSFEDKQTAKQFKLHCEKRAKQIKRTIFVEKVFLDDALDEWESFCLGYTEETRRLYISEIGKFMEFLSDDVVYISDLSTFHINGYLHSLMLRGLANKTVNNTLCALKSLCSFLTENYTIPNPAERIKKLREDPVDANYWNMEQYRAVLMNSPDFVRRWIRFIACTGLRATEFCNLRWQNYDLHGRTITVIGKGRKKRTIGLNDAAVRILEEMKDGKPVKPQDNVFLRRNGQPLSRYSLGWHIGEACRNAGLTGGGPHAARHFFATQLLLGGVPIIKVSALLGHSSVTTTQRHYSHILPPDLTDVTSILRAI